MAAGVESRLWEIGDIVKVFEEWKTDQAGGWLFTAEGGLL
jgi:hypothetical protein